MEDWVGFSFDRHICCSPGCRVEIRCGEIRGVSILKDHILLAMNGQTDLKLSWETSKDSEQKEKTMK